MVLPSSKFVGAPSSSGFRAVADWGCGDDMHHDMFEIPTMGCLAASIKSLDI